MKSIILTYPSYQTLPRGIKQMLVATENDFFSQAIPARSNTLLVKTPGLPISASRTAQTFNGRFGAKAQAAPIWEN